ncbi:MAG: hypothetical protein V1847_03315, partial [Candidatus Diapherotrites archaeon]
VANTAISRVVLNAELSCKLVQTIGGEEKVIALLPNCLSTSTQDRDDLKQQLGIPDSFGCNLTWHIFGSGAFLSSPAEQFSVISFADEPAISQNGTGRELVGAFSSSCIDSPTGSEQFIVSMDRNVVLVESASSKIEKSVFLKCVSGDYSGACPYVDYGYVVLKVWK